VKENLMEPTGDPDLARVEVVPVVVVSRSFPARPSSIPDIRDFVRRCLAQSPLSEEDSRAVDATVSQALLEAAGPAGTIQISFRIHPDHAEVDVLRSHPTLGAEAGIEELASYLHGDPARSAGAGWPDGGAPGEEPSFADWMAGVLRRQGLTLEEAARHLGVSVKTVSRWVGGATEPRLRDLRRIQELFGELPFSR
jgi:hypothetical protein